MICESCVAGLCALELLVTHTLRTFVSVVQFELLVTHTLLVCAFFNIGNGIVGINGIIGRAAALWGIGALQPLGPPEPAKNPKTAQTERQDSPRQRRDGPG